MSFWNDPSSLLPKQQHRWVITFGDHTTPSGKIGEYQATGSIIPPHFIKSVDRPNFEIGSIQAKYLYAHTFNFPKRLVWKPITISFNDVYDRQLEPTYADESLSVDIANSSMIEFKDQAWFAKNLKEAAQQDIQQKIPEKKYARSTQLIFYKFLQQFGYFEPNELESETEYLLRFRSYHFKRNMTKTLSGQNVDILNNNFSGDFKDHATDYYKDYFCILELDEDGNTIEKWKVYNPILTDLKTIHFSIVFPSSSNSSIQ